MPRKNSNLSQCLNDATQAQAKYISKLFPTDKYKNTLVIGSGIGRLSHALYSEMYKVTGLDCSPEYTLFAHESRPGPNYITGRIQDLNGEKFDLVISLENSFGYCSKSRKADHIIEDMTSLLNPGGGLLIQCGSMEWAQENIPQTTLLSEQSSGDVHTTRVLDRETRKLDIHYQCNGFQNSCSLLLFKKDEIRQELVNARYSEIEISDHLESTDTPAGDHFFALAKKQ